MIPNNYLEKVYGGFLGKCIGIRLGAPVEPAIWNFDRIREVYGYIDRYVKPYLNFAADDDSNGPAYFIRALLDECENKELTPQAVAKAWLNYAREGVGMFWWGGYGVSTEHTAYINLKKGIPAPVSGSIAQNGEVIAEQIGGQIFIDTFGLVNPCNVEKAAQYGEIAASVSHDGEGLLGARFFCAAIAKAFETSDIFEIINAALSQIPADSTYARVANAVLDFYHQNPSDFTLCMEMLKRDWGYDKFPGNCHIIPNAGVCILAMAYGEGDYCKTIEIACTCGWDTDCNAGNVGTVLGVACGVNAFPDKYRNPINDSIVLSGISGYLNIMDLPTFAKELALLGYRLAGEQPPRELTDSYYPGEEYFDFELPGSTHNIRVSEPYICQIQHSDAKAAAGTGSLEILFSQLYRGKSCKVFWKPFYTRADFSDERYMPVFSPRLVSGQQVSFKIYTDQWEGYDPVGIVPYIHTINGRNITLEYLRGIQGQWLEVHFVVPDTNGEIIDEVGFILEGLSGPRDRSRGRIYLDEFRCYGKGNYSIDIAKQRKDFGSITPFSHSAGAWRILNGILELTHCEASFSFTGNFYSTDQSITANITPYSGESHLLMVRAGGIMRGYLGGFGGNNKLVILRQDFGVETIAEIPFDWELNQSYELSLFAKGNRIGLSVNGKEVLYAEDGIFSKGMVGFGGLGLGRTGFSDIKIEEL